MSDATTAPKDPRDSIMGKICLLEIPVQDLARAMKFYTGVLQWDCNPEPYPFPDTEVRYAAESMHFFHTPGKNAGAFIVTKKEYQVAQDDKQRHVLPILPSFGVVDCAETLDKAVELGGKVQCPKMFIGGESGYFARFSDTEGNIVGVWSAK